MLKISKLREGSKVTYILNGRVDSSGSEILENELLEDDFSSASEINFDCANLEFISSAGLRLFLLLRRKVHAYTSINAININPTVRDVFELTGFAGVINLVFAPQKTGATVRAVYFGVEGITLNPDGAVSPCTKKALFQLRDKGIHRILSTVLEFDDLNKLPIQNVPFDGYILLNGAICLDEYQEIFGGVEIRCEDAEALLKQINAAGTGCILICPGTCFYANTDEETVKALIPENLAAADISKHDNEPVLACIVLSDGRGLILPDGCKVGARHEGRIAIVSAKCIMSNGMRQFNAKYDIPRNETMAFGNGENDFDTVRYAGIGVVMETGNENLRNASDYVTDSADKDGIMKALRHYRIL